MDLLARKGYFSEPGLQALEEVLAYGIGLDAGGVVVVGGVMVGGLDTVPPPVEPMIAFWTLSFPAESSWPVNARLSCVA